MPGSETLSAPLCGAHIGCNKKVGGEAENYKKTIIFLKYLKVLLPGMWEKYQGKLVKILYNPQAWHDTFLIVNFFISFTLLLLIFGEVVWALVAFRGVTFLTLHYSIYFGVDWLGSVYNFITFAAIGTVVFLANFLLANWIFNKRKILSYYLAASASLVLVFMLVVVSLMVYINWSNPGMG